MNIKTKSKNYKIRLIRYIGYNTTSKEKQNFDFVPTDLNRHTSASFDFFSLMYKFYELDYIIISV